MKTKILLFVGLIFSGIYTVAQIIHVPGDQQTIQAGIDVADEGDTVLVQPGTYYENIMFSKNITVASLFLTTGNPSYISETTIDGGQNSCVVRIGFGAGFNALLTGFTVTNGKGAYMSHQHYGGGITLIGSSPYLTQLENGHSQNYG